MGFGILTHVIILIATAVGVVIIFKKLNLSPVLGYLVAGGLIGDYGLRVVLFEDTEMLAELGIVFLLFATGLELSFERLRAMRKYVFGLGSLQVVVTAIVIAGIAFFFTNSSKLSVIIGGGLALSSTALVLQMVDTRSRVNQVGRVSLAVLIQQDFIVVPLLVIIPILADGGSEASIFYAILLAFLKAILALVGIFIAGRVFLRPIFKFISSDDESSNDELFIAVTLLICLSAALGTEALGLSMALGAFVAGILVAETEFRQRAEESIYPFKGLLLGLFFMSVGMTIDLAAVYTRLGYVIMFAFGLMLIKSIIIIALCRIFGFDRSMALRTGFLLSQGSEFAFILFKLAIEKKILPAESGELLLLVVTFTMALTPLVYALANKIASKWLTIVDDSSLELDALAKNSKDITNHVIIAGYGKTGYMASKMLDVEGINYLILDVNDKIVEAAQKDNISIFKADTSNIETLKAVGINRCLAVVLAINNFITIKKTLKVIHANCPDVTVIVKTKDLLSANELYDAGASIIVPSDYEIGLQLGGAVLDTVGISDYEIARIKAQFRSANYIVNKQYRYAKDDDVE
ncbi:MAG: cation:proton antiporter [Rickettsiaceae bacterium]|nr:cation:proton antiporter [Rickettsiaceae bacterium]